MEDAFKRQSAKVNEILWQNEGLAVRLFDLEQLWVKEEKFTAELRGRVEVLQVRWHLWGFCAFTDDQRLRISSASVGCLEAERCP